MNTFREFVPTIIFPVVCLAFLVGCGTTGKSGSKSVTVSESDGGSGLVVAMSEALAQSLVEGWIGAEIECGSDLDRDFENMLRSLDRGGRGSRVTMRSEDGTLVARRSGRSLKMKIDDRGSRGRIEVKMPWAVAECLLDGSAELSARDVGSIEIEITGSEGGSFQFSVD